MDTVVDELIVLERRCANGATLLQTGEIKRRLAAIADAATRFERSWSGSPIGYHSCVYYGEFDPVPPGAVFNREWGFEHSRFSNHTRGDWREWRYEQVVEAVLESAGNPDLEALDRVAKQVQAVFDECKEELLATLDAVLADQKDKSLQELRDKAEKLTGFIHWEELAKSRVPRGQIITRDVRALSEGIRAPPHAGVEAQGMSIASRGFALEQLGKTVRQCRLYLQKRMNLKGASMARTEGTVFIGHGRSPDWKDLKEFLRDRLKLKPDEFNTESAAGLPTTERLQEMLDSAVFAFIVMTAEDEHADKSTHARENVVHEAGLFQGRLGFRRAIVLLEEGCAEFSNLAGLGQIRFAKGKLKEKTEEIRQVLEREGLLK